jgi:hypothetical protein
MEAGRRLVLNLFRLDSSRKGASTHDASSPSLLMDSAPRFRVFTSFDAITLGVTADTACGYNRPSVPALGGTGSVREYDHASRAP